MTSLHLVTNPYLTQQPSHNYQDHPTVWLQRQDQFQLPAVQPTREASVSVINTLLRLATWCYTASLTHRKLKTNCEHVQGTASNWVSSRWSTQWKQYEPYPAQACRHANIVAKVSGGSWALLGWSFSGARPPRMDGHLLFKKVMQAWMKGSCGK